MFQGLVSGIEVEFPDGREPHVVVHAEDKLMALRMTRRMKTWENLSDADIASAIAALHGLAADTAAPGPTYAVVQQWNQSDLAFLRERARLIQAEIWIEDSTLKFKSRSQRSATTITLVQGRDLIDIRLRADLAHQRTAVKTSGCSGMAYALEFADESQPEDLIFESAGVKLLVDPRSSTISELLFTRAPALPAWPVAPDAQVFDAMSAPLCAAYLASCG